MGIQSFPVDAIAGAEESERSQESPKCSSPCGHRLIVGFELKAFPDRENGVVSGRESLSTRSCRPTSGLEILLSAPRTHGSEHPPWGTDSRGKPPAEDASRKNDGDSLTPAIAARFPDQDPPRLDRQQKEFCPFSGSSCRQSHSIPIAHSPSSCIAKASSRTSARDGSHLAKASLRCTERGDDEGERGVFSLLAVSPGTGDGAEELSCCTMDFMEACFLCKRRLGDGRDIFMYRGDKAFCSVECRHHQIVIDEQVELGKKYFSAVQKRGASSVQSRRSHHRTTRLLAVSTAAAA